MTEEEKLEEKVKKEPEKVDEKTAHFYDPPARYGGPGKSVVPLRYKPDHVWPKPARCGGPGKSSVPARYS